HEAIGLLADWNSRCQPQWSERELEQKLQNARRYGENPFGWKLTESTELQPRRYQPTTTASQAAMPVSTQFPSVSTVVATTEPDQPWGIEAALSPESFSSPDESGDDHAGDEQRVGFYSDDSITGEFSRRFEEELRYVPAWGWLEWTGRQWWRV